MTTIRKGTLLRVEFEIALPCDATEDEIDRWACFELGSGSISGSNPLCDHELVFWQHPPMLTNTGLVGRIEESGHQRRYIREPAGGER
jgi:hypothetical protein